MVVIRTRFLGHLSEDPTVEELEVVGPGAWWYREDLGIWKFYDGSEIRDLPVKVREVNSGEVTIPLSGGIVTLSISASTFGLSKISRVLRVEVERLDPVVADVYSPSYGINSAGDAVGITLAAGTGTTLSANVTVLGW